jgi:hypothetical protein
MHLDQQGSGAACSSGETRLGAGAGEDSRYSDATGTDHQGWILRLLQKAALRALQGDAQDGAWDQTGLYVPLPQTGCAIMKHIVGFSGGIDSQACARFVLNHFPAEDVILLNTTAGHNERNSTS